MTRRVPAVFALLIWAVLWEIVARVISSELFPPISAIVVSAFQIALLPSFRHALADTAQAFGVGMVISIVVGVPTGIVLGLVPSLARVLNVWIDIFISAPTTALVPALLPLFGIGQGTVVASVILFAVWIIILDTQVGIQKVSPSLIAMARTFGATRLQTYRKILLPAALPEIVTGLRLGSVRGIKGVIIGQVIVSLLGFGALFETYLESFDMIRFWGLILIVFVLSFIVVGAVGLLERGTGFYAASR